MKIPLLVSFSGGRTSALMTKMIFGMNEYSDFDKIVVFANTGKERPETLDFVKECSDRWGIKITWVESVVHHDERKSSSHKVVSYHSASRHGEPFEEVIRKYGVPGGSFLHCTRELKLNPIKSFMSSLGYASYFSAIGIRFDEPRRISANAKLIYPLFDMGITEKHVLGFWNAQPFDLRLKSYEGNCDLCWKKSYRKKKTLIEENPGIENWWIQMEKTYGDDNFFHRGNVSTEQLVADTTPFKLSTDPWIDEEKPCNCRTILSEEY